MSEFSADFEGGSVEIVLSVGGEEFESVELHEGEARVIEDVPFGWLTIDALDDCSGEGELTASSPTMSLLISRDGGCAVGG